MSSPLGRGSWSHGTERWTGIRANLAQGLLQRRDAREAKTSQRRLKVSHPTILLPSLQHSVNIINSGGRKKDTSLQSQV